MMQTSRQYLNAQTVLKYLLGDEEIDTLITCKNDQTNFVTYDHDLYQALGSLQKEDEFKQHRLVKFLENVDIVSFKDIFGKQKPVLKHERVNELRLGALGGSQWQK